MNNDTGEMKPAEAGTRSDSIIRFPITGASLRCHAPQLLPALSALMRLVTERRNRSDYKGGNPDTLAVQQEDATTHRTLQLALACAANETYYWNCLVVVPDDEAHLMQQYYLECNQLHNNVPVLILDEERMHLARHYHHFVAIATVSNLSRALERGLLQENTFSLILSAHASLDPTIAREAYSQYFPLSHIIFGWTRTTPNQVEIIGQASMITVYSTADIESIAVPLKRVVNTSIATSTEEDANHAAATTTIAELQQMRPASPAQSPEAERETFDQNSALTNTHRPEVDALIKILEERKGLDREAKDYEPRSLAVFQETGTGSQDIQHAFALTAANLLGLRVVILHRAEAVDEFSAIIRRAKEIYPHIRVGMLTVDSAPEYNSADYPVTIATPGGFGALLRAPERMTELFDLIIVSQGYTFRPHEVHEIIKKDLRKALLTLFWTSMPPADEVLAREAMTVGAISIFECRHLGRGILSRISKEKFMESLLRAGRSEGDSLFNFKPFDIHEAYLSEPGRSSIPFRMPDAAEQFERAESPYETLPPLSDLKVATISFIELQPITFVFDQSVPQKTEIPKDESVIQGMYIFVPKHFPDQCIVVHSILGYYARMVEGLIEETFHVRPAPTVAGAEERYLRMFKANAVPRQIIGSRLLRTSPRGSGDRFRSRRKGRN